MGISVLWKAPAVNPVNGKALSVPVLNPVNMYGRTFFFSTFGFLIAFLSWYAFPPLVSRYALETPEPSARQATNHLNQMTKTIKADLHLSQKEIANSNILALTATLVVRAIVGPLCDRYGPRYVFAAILFAGAIPTALAGTVTNATGLLILRFFIGILGASFVPCQVWSTGFFDKFRYARPLRLPCHATRPHPTRRLESFLHRSVPLDHFDGIGNAPPLRGYSHW